MTTSDTFTAPDIERAALTILSRRLPGHPLAGAYVEALCADPGEQRSFDVFIDTQPGLPGDAQLDQAGFGPRAAVLAWDTPNGDAGGNGGLYLWGDTEQPSPLRWARVDARFCARLDAEALRLAAAVVAFRRAGRPAGDQVAPLGTATAGYLVTSLAAAVAEYVDGLVLAYALREQERNEEEE